MSDETPKIHIRSLSIDLPDGREVRVGWRTDQGDECYYLFFKNAEGEETKLKLSPEAFDTLISLKPSVDLYRKTGSLFEWREINPTQAESQPDTA